MSYDINLINRKTKKVLTMRNPGYVRSGTVPAELNEYGELVQAKQIETSINITYNYASYYYDAAEGDQRFLVEEDGEMKNGGIRGVYGKPAMEAFHMLMDLYNRIFHKYFDTEKLEWKTGERQRAHLYDENGNEYDDPIYAILHDLPRTEEIETYTVSEGDTENYWEKTAANAIAPLLDMAHMTVEHLYDEDAVWDGD